MSNIYNKIIVLFDGDCRLCNSSVRFIIQRDKKDVFRFASLQSDFANKLLNSKSNTQQPLETILVIRDEKVLRKSEAVLNISKKLSGAWPLLYVFMIVPRFIRDSVYTFIANNRYRWFGKVEYCAVMRPEWKDKFID